MTLRHALAFLALCFAICVRGQAADAPDPDLPYQAERLNPVTYDVDFRVVITPPYHAKSLKVWLPLPQSDNGQEVTDAAIGDGPIDAMFAVIQRITHVGAQLMNYEVRSVTGGKDAQGEATVELMHSERKVRGRGVSTDILEASAKAYLAAINLIETGFGRVAGVSTAGALGPMQFLPSTFGAYGEGGDILSPHDSIMAAGRYLAVNGFASDRDHALYRYNNSNQYVQAVNDYAAVLAVDPAAFAEYHRWDVYYNTTAGDVVLPIGYFATAPIRVADYLATHPR